MGQYQNNRNIFFIKLGDWNLKLYNKFMSNPPYLDVDKVLPEHKLFEERFVIPHSSTTSLRAHSLSDSPTSLFPLGKSHIPFL